MCLDFEDMVECAICAGCLYLCCSCCMDKPRSQTTVVQQPVVYQPQPGVPAGAYTQPYPAQGPYPQQPYQVPQPGVYPPPPYNNAYPTQQPYNPAAQTVYYPGQAQHY